MFENYLIFSAVLHSKSVKDIFKPIFLKIAFLGIFLQIPQVWADTSNTFTEISPIITVKEEPKEQSKAEEASLYTARYLWNFLSGMVSKHKLQVAA